MKPRSFEQIKISIVKEAMWMLNKFCKTFSMYERFDHKTETYPTSIFIIDSINICRELIEDINLN